MMTMSSPSSLLLLTAFSLAQILLTPPCLAFAPSASAVVPSMPSTSTTRQSRLRPLFSISKQSAQQQQQLPIIITQTSLDKLEIIKHALKRPRGSSIGVEYNNAPTSTATATALSDGDLAILSMQLRKSKCAAIWTCHADSVATIANEQEESRGDFPGPVPVIYTGSVELIGDDDASAMMTAVVLDYGQDVDMDSLQDVGIIWKVNDMDQLQQLLGMEHDAGGVFLLSTEMLPDTIEDEATELKEMLSNLPKSIVTIAPLPTMLPENNEISLGKHYASYLGISSLILQNACVGDEEDIKYSQYAIEGIGKKSSSSFSMTGLTGSANGHFGVSSHGGEVKWRRNGE